MKTVIKSFSVMLIVLCIASCGGKKSDSSDSSSGGNKLEGTWQIVKAEGTMADANIGTQYIFEGADKLNLKGMGIDNPGKTVITDSTFTWEANNMKMEYTYKMEGAQLVVEVKNSGGQKFWLDKK